MEPRNIVTSEPGLSAIPVLATSRSSIGDSGLSCDSPAGSAKLSGSCSGFRLRGSGVCDEGAGVKRGGGGPRQNHDSKGQSAQNCFAECGAQAKASPMLGLYSEGSGLILQRARLTGQKSGTVICKVTAKFEASYGPRVF